MRNPVIAAKAVMTMDHLSGGRVEVALGVGDPSAHPEAAGVVAGAPGERVARFREFAEIIDCLLRTEAVNYHGRFLRCVDAEMIPRPVQRPRPPITIAAHGRQMLRIAAELADSWSECGGYDVTTERDLYNTTSDRCHRFDDECARVGRDTTTIRHSLVCFPPLTPWESTDYFADMVAR